MINAKALITSHSYFNLYNLSHLLIVVASIKKEKKFDKTWPCEICEIFISFLSQSIKLMFMFLLKFTSIAPTYDIREGKIWWIWKKYRHIFRQNHEIFPAMSVLIGTTWNITLIFAPVDISIDRMVQSRVPQYYSSTIASYYVATCIYKHLQMYK